MNFFKFSSLFFLFLFSGVLFSQQENVPSIQDDGTLFNSRVINSIPSNGQLKVMSCPSAATLTTLYATNNAQRGIMFDIQAINAITILCFDVNLAVGTTNIEIYTKTGTHVGFTGTPAAWTLVGTAVNVASAGVNLPTSIPIALSVGIGAGGVQAFYITRTTAGGPSVDYTNGTAVGNTLASDANLILKQGTGKDYPFGANFTTRNFNGTVYYNIGALAIELIDFTAQYEKDVVKLNWSTATENNNNFFTVERSKDAINFEEVKRITGAGNSSSLLNYETNDYAPLSGLSYYRIKYTDIYGANKYTPTKAVSMVAVNENIVVSPSPASDNITIQFNSTVSDNFLLSIYDMKGILVFSKDYDLSEGLNKIPVDLSGADKGIYQLNIVGKNQVQNSKFIKE
jgi:hypothetical protein